MRRKAWRARPISLGLTPVIVTWARQTRKHREHRGGVKLMPQARDHTQSEKRRQTGQSTGPTSRGRWNCACAGAIPVRLAVSPHYSFPSLAQLRCCVKPLRAGLNCPPPGDTMETAALRVSAQDLRRGIPEGHPAAADASWSTPGGKKTAFWPSGETPGQRNYCMAPSSRAIAKPRGNFARCGL